MVVGLIVAAVASVISDRFQSGARVTALLSGLVWPVVVVGAAQLALWTASVYAGRKAGSSHPARLRLVAPPR